MRHITTSKLVRCVDDEEEAIAARYAVPLLITGGCREAVEVVARRVHRARCDAAAPFVAVGAGAFPSDVRALKQHLFTPVNVAAGGTMFIADVEEMPVAAQRLFFDVLTDHPFARHPRRAIRVVAGTTVWLLDRVAAGTFSEELFYRLNLIHLIIEHAAREPAR